MINIRNSHFLKYRLYRISYLKFYKSLKRLGIEFLTEHFDESFYLAQYKEFGYEYLKFLHDAIKLKLDEIVNMKDFREHKYSSILKWVFMSIEEDRRNENN